MAGFPSVMRPATTLYVEIGRREPSLGIVPFSPQTRNSVFGRAIAICVTLTKPHRAPCGRQSEASGLAPRPIANWPTGPFDVEFDARHLCEEIDIRDPDRTTAEPHVGRHQVKRLHKHADVLQNERIGDRAVLPGNPAKAGRDRDQDLRRSRRAHRGSARSQQRFELIRGDADRRERVGADVVMIEAACKPFA